MQAALTKFKFPSFSGLTIGRVYNVYPEANMVDVMLFDGTLLSRIQIMGSYSSSFSGVVNLPLPKYKDANKDVSMIDREYPLKDASYQESDVIAVVGFLGGSIERPIVLGFLFPEQNEILCKGKDQKGNKDGTQFLWKHESNVYTRVAKGDTKDETPEIEISHPSGLLIKIGNNSTRTEIVNWDRNIRPFKWKNRDTNNLDPAPYLHIFHPSGTYFTVDPDGNVTAYVVGNMNETVRGDVNRLVEGNETETIKGSLTRIVEGDESSTVKGDWNRSSDTQITDKAPNIHHNP